MNSIWDKLGIHLFLFGGSSRIELIGTDRVYNYRIRFISDCCKLLTCLLAESTRDKDILGRGVMDMNNIWDVNLL